MHVWRPYTQEGIARSPLNVDRASGAYIQLRSGQKIFDGMSSWWLITHGHCHPEIARALAYTAERTDQVVFADFMHEPAEALMWELSQILPKSLSRAFFSDNGSTSVEVALKMVLQFWQHRGFLSKSKFIGFVGAYHGDTVGAMSVSDDSPFNRPFRPILFDVKRQQLPETDQQKKHLEQVVSESSDIAGIIVEPLVQGAGGMRFWSSETVQWLSGLCKRYSIKLIFDEVMTGFGRTGSMFAFQKANVIPDVLCLSKGLTGGMLPMGLTLTSEEVYQAFLGKEKAKAFFHGHSFTGNPLSCAAAVANIKLFKNPDLKTAWKTIETSHKQALKRISTRIPVENPRVCGTIGVFDLKLKESGYLDPLPTEIMYKLIDKNLFIRPLGSVFYLMPPYCATEIEINWAWDTIADVVFAHL